MPTNVPRKYNYGANTLSIFQFKREKKQAQTINYKVYNNLL